MKKKLLFLSLLLAVAMLLTCVFAFGVGAEEAITMTDVAAGTKTPVAGDTVTIADAAELKAFSAYVSKGGVTQGITFKLDSSIDSDTGIVIEELENANNTNFNPIGGVYNGSTTEAVPFLGTFDGNGKAVSGLIFSATYYKEDGTFVENGADTNNLGFFALLGDGAVVKNLTLVVNNVLGVKGSYFGVLASEANGATVTNCAVATADSTAKLANFGNGETSFVGGLLGRANDSKIDRCGVNVVVSAKGSAAGIVGLAEGKTEISNCIVSGEYTHTAEETAYLGGIVAKLDGTSSVKNCYSSVAASLTTGRLGGIAGYVGENATVENCLSLANFVAKANAVGLLVGENKGTVKSSYSWRDPSFDDKTFAASGKHYDIAMGSGKRENVLAFQAKTEGGVTTFLIGDVIGGTLDCPDCDNDENTALPSQKDCPNPAKHFTGGKIRVNYSFVANKEGTTTLLDALNGWIGTQENGAATYDAWSVQTDGNITPCKHSFSPRYLAYIGDMPTCKSTGTGDKLCLICDLLLEKNVTVPVNPTAHRQPVYPCVDSYCTYCDAFLPAEFPHSIPKEKSCGDQTCAKCGTVVEADPTVHHTRPAEGPGSVADPEKPCLKYTCVECGSPEATDVAHTLPETEFKCEEGLSCTVCGQEAPPLAHHRSGLPATCTRQQICLDCRKVIRDAKGHTWGDPATCGSAQVCLDCGLEGAPATGEHVYDYHVLGDKMTPAADCTNASVCVKCGYVGQNPLGHVVLKTASTCGLGQPCSRCSAVVTPASGDHIIDLTRAKLVRSATAERSGIVEGNCLDCGRKVEAYITVAVTEKTGNVLISGGSFTFYAGSRVEAEFGKVADYKELDYKRGYIPLQVVTISSVVDITGSEITLPGGLTIKIALNKSAAQMSAETFKLYKVEDEALVEIEVTSVEDGFLVFNASALGTFVLAGDEDAAFEVLGVILPEQPQQTAALIGTASYEKREFEI